MGQSWGRGGCSDIYGATSPEAALDQIAYAVQAALSAAGKQSEDILAGCFSLAGADWPEDYTYLQARMEAFGFGRTITIYNDALRAGPPDGTGIVIACGTGAAIAARNAEGRYWHTSFWQNRWVGSN